MQKYKQRMRKKKKKKKDGRKKRGGGKEVLSTVKIKQSKILIIKVHDETASGDSAVAEEYPFQFKRLIHENNCRFGLFFNEEETGLHGEKNVQIGLYRM